MPRLTTDHRPDCFDVIAEHCRRNPSRKSEPDSLDGEHFKSRLCYLGDVKERIYCLLAYVICDKGSRWFAYLMTTTTGKIDGELVPLDKWTVGHQLNACVFRKRFADLEPEIAESTDADGYIFRGPFRAQNSEPDGGKEADSFKNLPPRGNA